MSAFGVRSTTIRAPAAAAVAWLLLLLIDAAFIALTSATRRPIAVRAVHYAYVAGHMGALALVSAALASALQRAGRRRPAVWVLALAALVVPLGFFTLADDLFGPAQQLAEVLPSGVLHKLLIVVVALGVPAAAIAGRLLAARRLRWAGVLGGAALGVQERLILPSDYPGAHLYLALAAAALIAASLTGARLPRLTRLLRRPLLRRSLIVIGLALAALTLVRRPQNAAVVALMRDGGTVIVPFAARARAALDGRPSLRVLARAGEWFNDRRGAPDVPPTEPRMMPPNAIVVLLTIDALREDVLGAKQRDKSLPVLSRIKSESLRFERAWAPGSQTVYTLSTMFSGLYFSQQYWAVKEDPNGGRYLWPAEEKAVRFPELLSAAGVPTVTYAGALFLQNEWGIVRGFQEEHFLQTKVRYAPASMLVDAALARIGAHGGGPLFLYMHFLDAHQPYDRGGTSGPPFERYLRELALVDAQIGRLVNELKAKGFWGRTALIITADHGEAFGEHGTTSHASTLYEELLRVPLYVRLPRVAPRAVTERVSLIDIGPTILDLYGLPTPGRFMGQTLLPLMRGGHAELTRPIVAEGRLKRAMLFPDGMKIITDDKIGTLELYDLKTDPDELNDLFDELGPRADERLLLLRGFFDAHTYRENGYQVPYRR